MQDKIRKDLRVPDTRLPKPIPQAWRWVSLHLVDDLMDECRERGVVRAAFEAVGETDGYRRLSMCYESAAIGCRVKECQFWSKVSW